MHFQDAQVEQIIQEINGTSEKDRRMLAKRRHDIYKDGGKAFLIEKIVSEFGSDALREMRIAPVNLLKKLVNKRAAIYRRPPTRRAQNKQDQGLVDYYERTLKLNELMQKVDRYFTLFSNTVIYTVPVAGKLKSMVIPSYLYSVVPDPLDLTKHQGYVFSSFVEAWQGTPRADVPSSSGEEGFSKELGFKTANDLVDSSEKDAFQRRQYIFWSDQDHFTTDYQGTRLILDTEKGSEQFENPIEMLPVVNIAKDRDNESWATQGEDMIDLTIAVQLGFSDLLTIAKHQGFSILTVVSPEEPKKLTIGVSKAVWLKQPPEGPSPTISYVQGNSPLEQYKELLMDMIGLLLSSNDMDPATIGGHLNTKNFTSGFHALIAAADNLEAIELDKPILRDAEVAHFNVIKAWHNYLYDIGALEPEAAKLGKFSEEFDLSVSFSEIQPIESEGDRLGAVERLTALGLITKKQALKRLHPDLTDDQIAALLSEIEAEAKKNQPQMNQAMGSQQGMDPKQLPVTMQMPNEQMLLKKDAGSMSTSYPKAGSTGDE